MIAVKYIALGGVLAGLAAGWGIHSLIAERTLRHALVDQQQALEAKCADDKAITKEIADDLNQKNASLSRRLAELKRLPATCIVPTSDTALGGDAIPGGAVNAGAHGITSVALYDFAAEAERYRQQLISCQEFVLRERKWTR